MMKTKLKSLLIILLTIIFFTNQINANAFYIYSAKSKSLRAQENLASTLLPTFRYGRNNIELNQKESIDVILEKQSLTLTVEVISAEGTGLGIDNTTLLKNGLKIFKPASFRAKNGRDTLKEQTVYLQRNKATFNLKNIKSQSLIIDAADFKIFKVFVKGFLPGSYTLKATVDGQKSTTTTVFTKADFRLDTVNPSIIDPGIETTLTIIGKGLDSLTQVSLGSTDIEVKGTEALDDTTLRVKAFAQNKAARGFRNVTITSPILGKTVTLVNGLFVNSQETLGTDISDITEGTPGMDGLAGMDGMSICSNPNDLLMVFANNLSAGNQATVNFDPSSCSLNFGIPVGFNGVNGGNGSDGKGLCNDMTLTPTTITNTLSAGSTATVTLDSVNCTLTYGIPQGATGTTGTTGATGATGASGLNSLVKVSTEASGTNCSTGGKKVESGLDSNNNNVLDSGEVTATNYVCNGNNNIPTIEQVITSWSTYSAEQNYTTASGATSRMVKIPRFINDGIIYGGFWVDKYEASRSDATATAEGTSTVPVSIRGVVPWTSINLSSAQSNASNSNRQITSLGSCHLIGMKEWTAIYLLGRFAKEKNIFGATSTNGWNERGNTRTGKDLNNTTCSDDPVEPTGSGGSLGRCLTGTGVKSWGHLLDGTATTNPSGTALGASADSATNSTSAFDGDLQVYDLVGNIKEWIDFTVTRASAITKVDTGYQGSGITLPFNTNSSNFNFEDLAGASDIDFQGLGLPTASGSLTDTNGGFNGGKFLTDTMTNAQYGTVRGGTWTDGANAPSPLTIDISTATTTTETSRGFRVTCDFASGQ